jgi:hypothetical protein
MVLICMLTLGPLNRRFTKSSIQMILECESVRFATLLVNVPLRTRKITGFDQVVHNLMSISLLQPVLHRCLIVRIVQGYGLKYEIKFQR